MLTRREAVIGVAAAGAVALLHRAQAFAAAPMPRTKVNFQVPPGACDCHVHINGDPKRYPMIPTRNFTPDVATMEEMRQLFRALHIERAFIVQPSFYGTDNSCTLDQIQELGIKNARGMASVDLAKITDKELDQLDRGGIRALRVGLGPTVPEFTQRFQALVQRLKGRKWHLNTNIPLSIIDAVQDQVMASPVPIALDHFAGLQASRGLEQAGLATLLKLLKGGNVYVKLSRIHNISTQAPDYPDVVPLAKALIAANPQRMLWGSDWPHAGAEPRKPISQITPFVDVDDAHEFNMLPVWAPDPAQRKAILVDNPARLYGF